MEITYVDILRFNRTIAKSGQINHKGFWALMDLTEPRQKISPYNTHVLNE